MPRIVKEYDERYTQFLDVAQQLFYRQGYDQTSVQEIIAAMGVAKGLFYYYFRSKGDLLDAIIERIAAQTVAALTPVVADPSLDAPTKLTRIFDQGQSWKLANKAFVLDLMHVLYRDENVLLRTKLTAATVAMVVPLVAQIIEQGVAAHVFAVNHPLECAQIIFDIQYSLSNTVVHFLLGAEELAGEENAVARAAALAGMDRKLDAFTCAIERVLGAAPGSLCLVRQEDIHAWLQ